MKRTQPLFIANWKMHFTLRQSIAQAEALRAAWEDFPHARDAELVVCPSFDAIAAVADIFEGSGIMLGAQDMFWKDTGAYTGEVSGRMLGEIGCQYVILGHSERRRTVGEHDDMINLKVHAAIRNNIIPILCVGETYEERTGGRTDHVLARQVAAGLKDVQLSNHHHVYVAYEPVWVIGTGHAVTGADATHAAQVIAQALIDSHQAGMIGRSLHVIYGGSVDEMNIRSLLTSPLLAGSLIGTASLSHVRLMNIIRAVV